MSEQRKRSSRSVSAELDSDGELIDDNGGDDDGSGVAPGKPGRKKNPNSQAARRDQNRIAQREFRLRKQQRIRDLEARVEILSGSKDETYVQMRDIIRELIAENRTLRNMVRGLSSFIGDGVGGALPTIGWTMNEFDSFINKADTDTAYEAFVKRKKAMQEHGGMASAGTGEKRPAAEDPSARKRPKVVNGYSGPSSVDFAPSLGPGSFNSPYSPDPNMTLFSNIRPPPNYSSNFINGLANDPQGGPNTFLTGTAGPSGLSFGSSSNPSGRDPFSYQSGTNASPQPSSAGTSLQTQSYLPPMSSGSSVPTPPSQPSGNSPNVDDGDPKAQEARKLVGYHLENFSRNAAYCLPPSLRPTLVQRTVEHEGIINGIVHPEIRNRMILLRGRFDLADCIHSYLKNTTIHGDDVLAHANWEINEEWLKQYGYLVDPSTLALTNRWRKERGEPEIPYSEIAPSEQLPGMP
ncbi:hypothetical protein M422DRAFT_22723 [Sphaerobolus stellatus SS14]|nr:hypothetical protein M422DRAFT_22723 [Sphaerobolus stellatus SS14]